jgi:hypothetical protein
MSIILGRFPEVGNCLIANKTIWPLALPCAEEVDDNRINARSRMTALGLGCVKTPTLSASVEKSRKDCVSGSQIILRTDGSMQCGPTYRPHPFKLARPFLPTMMWSCTEISSGRATVTIAWVIAMSARDGEGSPPGWLCINRARAGAADRPPVPSCGAGIGIVSQSRGRAP